MRFLSFVLQVPLYPKVSVGAIITQDGEYLVVDLTYRDGLAFPGGMIEPLESVEQALQREIKEETGFNIVTCKYFTSVPDTQYGIGVLALVFVAEIDGKLRDSPEGEARWETAENILNNCSYKNWREAFIKYLNEYESPRL